MLLLFFLHNLPFLATPKQCHDLMFLDLLDLVYTMILSMCYFIRASISSRHNFEILKPMISINTSSIHLQYNPLFYGAYSPHSLANPLRYFGKRYSRTAVLLWLMILFCWLYCVKDWINVGIFVGGVTALLSNEIVQKYKQIFVF